MALESEARGSDPPGPYGVDELRRFAGAEVHVRLADGIVWTGVLRTELLTDRSLSVYLSGRGGDGATLYIDQIVAIERDGRKGAP